MKKVIVVMYSVILGFISINANELKKCSTEEDKIQGCIEEAYKAEDGLLGPVEYMCRFIWKNGSLDGDMKCYYTNGYTSYLHCLPLLGDDGCARKQSMIEVHEDRIRAVIPFKNKKEHGIARVFYESGELMSEEGYDNGIATSYKQYYASGNLMEEKLYNKNGELYGVKSYYNNGNIKSEIPYKNDKKNGIEKKYKLDGKIESEIPYENDKLEGIVKIYRNGVVFTQVVFNKYEAVSGKCGKRELTFAQLHKINSQKSEEDKLSTVFGICR